MNEKLIKELIKESVIITIGILKVITADMNSPDTNLYYKLLFEHPILKERINAIKESR